MVIGGMVRVRHIFAFALVALVALFAQQGVVQGPQGRVGGYAEYCIGEVATTVALNAEGEPVAPHHHCPECAPQVLTALPVAAVFLRPIVVQSVEYSTDYAGIDVQQRISNATIRGPPVFV